MKPAPGQWDDLLTRTVSGGTVAALGLLIMWLGGIWFQALCALVAAVMVWELSRILGGHRWALPLAALSGAVIAAASVLPPGFILPLLMLPAIAGIGSMAHDRVVFAIYTVMILLAAFGLMILRSDYGFIWLAWLVIVVVVTDLLGYFAGRMIGGPKLWPRVSPKKTWSGTVAGWVGAACVGLAFMQATGAGPQIISVSIAASMAGQLGDIAESAVKRRSGIKDSSNLIPGHGGLFDRFDALLGASVFLLLTENLISFPPGPP